MPWVYSNQSTFGTQEEIRRLYEAGCVHVQDILNERDTEGGRNRKKDSVYGRA